MAKTKEEFLITAVKNLRRRIEFGELHSELQSGQITKEEFKKELEENEDKYTIPIRQMEDENDIFLIQEIVAEIGMVDVSCDDVGELFSIDARDIVKAIEKLHPIQ